MNIFHEALAYALYGKCSLSNGGSIFQHFVLIDRWKEENPRTTAHSYCMNAFNWGLGIGSQQFYYIIVEISFCFWICSVIFWCHDLRLHGAKLWKEENRRKDALWRWHIHSENWKMCLRKIVENRRWNSFEWWDDDGRANQFSFFEIAAVCLNHIIALRLPLSRSSRLPSHTAQTHILILMHVEKIVGQEAFRDRWLIRQVWLRRYQVNISDADG